MTARAVTLGIFSALFVCGFTYYNHQVLGQNFLISHPLPIGVFGVLLALWLINPLWRRLRPGLELAPAELAVLSAAAGGGVPCFIRADVGSSLGLTNTFLLQYNLGVGTRDQWPREGFSRVSFDNLTRQLSALSQGETCTPA